MFYGGHLCWLAGSPDTFFKLDTQMMIEASLVKFGPVVSEEKIFVKVNDNDGHQVMRKAHLALWKKVNLLHIFVIMD